MKKDKDFYYKSKKYLTGVIFCFLFIHVHVYAQNAAEVGISVFPGYTLVNFENALEYSDDYMEDWDQFYLSVKFHGFLPSQNNFQLGAEFGWNKLYYAYYRIPYATPTYVYREFSVSTLSLMAMGRYTFNKFFLLGRGGLHFFDSGTSLALGGEAGWNIMLSDNLIIPLSIRITTIFGDGTPSSVSLGSGLKYLIGK